MLRAGHPFKSLKLLRGLYRAKHTLMSWNSARFIKSGCSFRVIPPFPAPCSSALLSNSFLDRVHVAVKPFQSIFEVKGVRINILSRELHSFQMVTKGRGAQSYCTNVIFLSRFHPRHPGFIQAQVLSSCEHLSRTSVCALLADAAFQVNWKEAHFFLYSHS